MTTTTGPSDVSGRAPLGAEPDRLAELLAQKRPIVMGVLNITPDSFSDGGLFVEPEAAVEQAQRMIDEGADIIDIGGESTRPYEGARPISLEEELERLEPVLPLVTRLAVPVSIDSMKPEVSLWALSEGASIVNDVWGLQRDPNMARVVADHGVPVIIMHNRYKADPTINIFSDINAFFAHSLEIADKAGIIADKIVLDPGIGFGKTPEQSISVIARLAEFKRFERPLMVGASRKRFINHLSPSGPAERIGGSLAAHLLAVLNGAAIIRTHDVAETVQAIKVASAIRSAK
jgi:dihydropteroate synthase